MFPEKAITKPEEIRFLLSCARLPGRLSTGQTAVLLGFQDHDMPVLIAAKLLEPLGRPASNAIKYFAAADVVERANSRDWLSKATREISRHWREKNARKTSIFTGIETQSYELKGKKDDSR